MEILYRRLRENWGYEEYMFVDDLVFINGVNGTTIVPTKSVANWKKEYACHTTALSAACFLKLFIEDKDVYCGEMDISVAINMLNSIVAENNISEKTLQIATWVYRRTPFAGAKSEDRRIEFWYDTDVSPNFLFNTAARLDAEARARRSKIHFNAEYGDTPYGHEEYFYAFW